MRFTELETDRLFLRKFREEDFSAIHSWASYPGNVKYMLFGPNTEEDTRGFLSWVTARSEEDNCQRFEYIAALKETGEVIGSAGIGCKPDCETAEVGWILHRDHWNRGFGTEIARALLDFGFGTLDTRRIIAKCDAENYPSYHVMEKIGMRREGHFIKARRGNKVLGRELRDELAYAVLREEWETQNLTNFTRRVTP